MSALPCEHEIALCLVDELRERFKSMTFADPSGGYTMDHVYGKLLQSADQSIWFHHEYGKYSGKCEQLYIRAAS